MRFLCCKQIDLSQNLCFITLRSQLPPCHSHQILFSEDKRVLFTLVWSMWFPSYYSLQIFDTNLSLCQLSLRVFFWKIQLWLLMQHMKHTTSCESKSSLRIVKLEQDIMCLYLYWISSPTIGAYHQTFLCLTTVLQHFITSSLNILTTFITAVRFSQWNNCWLMIVSHVADSLCFKCTADSFSFSLCSRTLRKISVSHYASTLHISVCLIFATLHNLRHMPKYVFWHRVYRYSEPTLRFLIQTFIDEPQINLWNKRWCVIFVSFCVDWLLSTSFCHTTAINPTLSLISALFFSKDWTSGKPGLFCLPTDFLLFDSDVTAMVISINFSHYVQVTPSVPNLQFSS